MLLGALFSAPLAVLAMLLCGAVGIGVYMLCSAGALTFWPAVTMAGGAYVVLYLFARNVSEINALGVCSLLGVFATLFAATTRLLSYISGVLLVFVLIVLAAVTAVTSISIMRTRRQRELWAFTGMCEKCGYDLRATDDRCPECGSAVPEHLVRLRRIRTRPATPPPGTPTPDDGTAP